jgi:ABC-type phosphate/phosphonate transport system substrate-binding protein
VARTLIFAVVVLTFPTLARAQDKDVYKIGIPRSIFRDVPPALLAFAGQPLKDLMKTQGGIEGDVVNAADAMSVARDIDAGKLHLGVFFGHEFAQAKDKYPKLEAIVCTAPRPREVQAFLIVRWDCEAKSFADMKGTKLAIANKSRDHARLFLAKKQAEELGGESNCTTEKCDTVHDAIEKVLEGEADVTVVDAAAWNYFQKLYPGRSKNLRELARSDVFPPTVIAYKTGSLDEAVVKSLREGLLTAHENAKAARLMNLIRIDRFDSVPENYDESLKACLKAYPTPLPAK